MTDDRKYSTDWIDFVTYPLRADRVSSMAERIDTAGAYRPKADGQYPEEYSPGCEEGAVIEKAFVEADGDRFQAMYFDHFGNVTVWTERRIWHTRNQGNVERFLFTPRDHTELAPPKTSE